MTGIRIKGIDIYHPSNIVGNDFFIKHFDEKGIDIRGLLSALGRITRYSIKDADENSLTMAFEAARNVLESQVPISTLLPMQVKLLSISFLPTH
ncbi:MULTISPECIES: hypothetical protein [Paenibacillus]|uniref:hypothetical protein n=1 Tax=Paenibacillus TaxID=44249 RepID=UPI002116835E|nr:hypothetical protein [Paenibacillus odorifer]